MNREYMTPDIDVTVYEIEDVITLSIKDCGMNGSDDSWHG